MRKTKIRILSLTLTFMLICNLYLLPLQSFTAASEPKLVTTSEETSKTELTSRIINDILLILGTLPVFNAAALCSQSNIIFDCFSNFSGIAAKLSADVESYITAIRLEQEEEEIEKDPLGGENNITLKVWSPSYDLESIKARCEHFEALYPDKNIDIECAALGVDESRTRLLNDPATAADVFIAASDYMYSLKDFLNPLTFSTENSDSNIPQSVDAFSIDNKLYAYPKELSGYALIYDKRVLNENDVKSLETILSKCEQKGKKFIYNASDGYYSCVFPFTGGMTVTTDEYGTQVANYNEKDVIASLKAFGTLFKNSSSFQNGALYAMTDADFKNFGATVTGMWDVSLLKQKIGDNLGFAVLPTIKINGSEKKLKGLMGYTGMAVNAQTRFPVTAAALAEFLTNEDSQSKYFTSDSKTPSNAHVISDPALAGFNEITALAVQAEYFHPQKDIMLTFWDPMGALGMYVTDPSSSFDDKSIKDELEKTVKAMCEEW